MLDFPGETSRASGRAKPRLAIVSTFDDLCGIAGYTRALAKQIGEHFDVEIFDLDQFLMRSTNRNVRAIADQTILDWAQRLSEFDAVNIQLEHGTFGRSRHDILRRFRILATAAPALSVTFHTVLPEGFAWREVFGELRNGEVFAVLDILGRNHANKTLNRGIYGLLQRLQRGKPVSVIVHTRREMRLMKYVNGFKEVFEHPLAFLGREDAQRIREEAKRSEMPGLAALPPDAKVIGVFGFLNEYKGFDTAIKALHLLPANYHLALFGGLHPNEIKKGAPVNDYVRRLMDETYADRSVFDTLPGPDISMSIATDQIDRLYNHPKNIGSRVHFMGTQTDDGLARGMAVCDVVVLPYREIGQTSSGPMSIALEMGARVLASRTHAFLQYARYHPDAIEFFEIGNHLELAERIRSLRPAAAPELQYDAATNAAVYVAANTRQSSQGETSDPDAALIRGV